jgi:hypothetical protein
LVSLETTDLFKGAFLMCSGGDLAEVRVRDNGRRIATFLITGPDLDRFDNYPDTGGLRHALSPVCIKK